MGCAWLWLKFRSKPLTDPLLITSAHTALNCTKNTNRLFGGVVLPNLSPRSLKFTRAVGWLELQMNASRLSVSLQAPFISHFPSEFLQKKKLPWSISESSHSHAAVCFSKYFCSRHAVACAWLGGTSGFHSSGFFPPEA